MIFIQLICDNFCDNFIFYTYIIFLPSLSIVLLFVLIFVFLCKCCLISCHTNGCSNNTPQFKKYTKLSFFFHFLFKSTDVAATCQ